MKQKWFRVLALLLGLTMVAAACGDDDGGDDTAAPENESVPGDDEGERCDATVPGTQIDYGVYAPTAMVDPPFSSGSLVGGTELAAVYDVLMTYDLESGEYEPKLAESLEPNDDFTVWTLTLREGITYSDGTLLTAQLVADNMDRYFGQGVRNTSAGFMTSIVEKEAVDDRTLVITLEAPWSTFPFVFADEPGMIVNINAIGDDPAAFGAHPPDAAGLGPYVVERNVPGEELVMTARQDYWDGPVCIESLRFVFVPGAQATYDAFRSGQLDVAFLRDSQVIGVARDAGENSIFVQQDAGAAIMSNVREGRPGADPLVREAMTLALDEEVINQRAYGGQLSVGRSVIQEGSRYYSDAIKAFPKDEERAREALEEAKANGYDGQLELLCPNAPPAPETALAVEGLLEAVGFEVAVRTMPSAEHIGELVQGNYDAACWGVNAGPATAPTAFLRFFHSESTVNRQGYANPEMDEALAAILAAGDEEERSEAMAQMNNIVIDDWALFNYGATEEGIVWRDGVENVRATVATIFLFDKAFIEE